MVAGGFNFVFRNKAAKIKDLVCVFAREDAALDIGGCAEDDAGSAAEQAGLAHDAML